jgi:hypothetical protein
MMTCVRVRVLYECFLFSQVSFNFDKVFHLVLALGEQYILSVSLILGLLPVLT